MREPENMDKIIDKLSEYNILTNLFPGAIYCFLATKFFDLSLVQDDLFMAAFVYYFCGMVISRISSILIEPVMKKSRFVTYADYKDYTAASTVDSHIKVLLETSNSYRSVMALFLSLLGTGAWTATASAWSWLDANGHYVISVALLALFSFAFRKQTQYIKDRVDLHKSKSGIES